MRQMTRPGPVDAPVHARVWSVAPARLRPSRARTGRSSLARWALRALTNLLLLTVLVLFAGLAIGPHLFGYRTMTMLTGSMAPGINPGDVTVAFPEPVSELAPGQVLSYHIPVDDHRVVSHRVVTVTRRADGSVQVQTRGDHNPGVDPWTAVITDQQVWRVRAVVPHLGTVIQALRGPGMRTAFIYVAPALLTLLLLSRIWRSPRTRPGATAPAPGQARRRRS